MTETKNKTLIKSICIDTLTQIQEDQFALDRQKPGHDKWKDYAQDILTFTLELQNLGFELVLILGDPGYIKNLIYSPSIE